MARVSLDGVTFIATPLRELDDGDWLMEARQHGPRWTIGTPLRIRASDILEMASAEMPADDGQAALNKALAEERARIPDPRTYLQGIKTHPDAGRKDDSKE
jgi:hypothetical protein